MRVWFIPYGYLDSQRLVSQHNEVHGLTTVILKGDKWGSISDEFKHSVHFLETIHQRCVDELAVRARLAGREVANPHPSPYVTEYPGIHRTKAYKPTRAQLETDVKQLRAKWEAEGYFFGMGRLNLRQAEAQLGLPEARSWDSAQRVRIQTKAFVKDHKDELKAMGSQKRLWEKLQALGYKVED